MNTVPTLSLMDFKYHKGKDVDMQRHICHGLVGLSVLLSCQANAVETKTSLPNEELNVVSETVPTQSEENETHHNSRGLKQYEPEKPDVKYSVHSSLKTGMMNYTFSLGSSRDFNPSQQSMPVVAIETGINTENLPIGDIGISLLYQKAKRGHDGYFRLTDAEKGFFENVNMLFGRDDYGITASWNVYTAKDNTHKWVTFGGYKWGRTDFTANVVANTNIYTQTVSFDTKGPFVGLQYAYSPSKKDVTLGASLTGGFLEGNLTYHVVGPFKDSNEVNNTFALRGGVYLLGPLFNFGSKGTLNYRIAADYSNYSMKLTGTNDSLREKIATLMGSLEWQW